MATMAKMVDISTGKWRPIPKSKYFGGVRFQWKTQAYNKRFVETRAKWQERDGYLTRIVPFKVRDGTVYALYTRKAKRSR